jgi:penicillin-binding protein 2
MGVVGNGGTLYQTRLVSQVQSVDGQIVTAYDVRPRGVLEITEKTMDELRAAMISVVESRAGTAGRVQMDNVRIAGKTGTAQWGPKSNERTAAWFAGFAPAEAPRYAFAALYEGEPNDDDIHGGTNAAPLIGRVLKEILKDEVKPKRKPRKSDDDDDDRVADVAKVETPKPRPPAPTPVKRGFFNFFRPGAH